MQAWWLDTCFAQAMACELVGEAVALCAASSPAQDPGMFRTQDPPTPSASRVMMHPPHGANLHNSHVKLVLRRWTRGV